MECGGGSPRGRTVAVPFGAAAHRATLGALREAGLEPGSDVQVTNLGLQEIVALVGAGADAETHRWGATDSLASNHPYKDLPPIFDNSPKLSPQPYVYPVGSVVSTWSPTAIVGNNAFEVWFDANDSSTVTGTTQITEWKDKSGNDRHAGSPLGSPAYVSNGGPNSMPAVRILRSAGVSGKCSSRARRSH